MAKKTLKNTTASGAKKNVKDIEFWGNGDMFKLLSKASSKAEGWMKSTKAMEIPGLGCTVQVTTQQWDQIAEAVTFVPGVFIHSIYNAEGKVTGRILMDSRTPAGLKFVTNTFTKDDIVYIAVSAQDDVVVLAHTDASGRTQNMNVFAGELEVIARVSTEKRMADAAKAMEEAKKEPPIPPKDRKLTLQG